MRTDSPAPAHRRVLIIDDERPFAEAVAEFFADRGCETRAVYSISAALQELSQFDPNVVIADIRMPDGQGLDLLEVIRGTGERRVVVIVTAYGDMHHVWRALQFDADGFLRKPVEMEQLARLVDAAMERKDHRP